MESVHDHVHLMSRKVDVLKSTKVSLHLIMVYAECS